MEFLERREYIASFCDRFGYPEEAKETFLKVYDDVGADKELAESFFRPVLKYEETGKLREYRSSLCAAKKETACGKVAKKLQISPYTADFVFCLCWIPTLEKLYEKKKIDKKIFEQGMLDFGAKLWECKRVYNVWGSFVAGWFAGWFAMTRFAIGRLQYEPLRTFWFSGKLGKYYVPIWRQYLNIHIPSIGPLRHEEVVASYLEAYEFFRKHFHYRKKMLFTTTSWLLSPDHDTMFPPESNIRQFIADFHRFNIYEEPENSDFWRVYNRPYDKNNLDCSGDTTMQKGYAEILQKGGHMKHAAGVFLYDGKEFNK